MSLTATLEVGGGGASAPRFAHRGMTRSRATEPFVAFEGVGKTYDGKALAVCDLSPPPP